MRCFVRRVVPVLLAVVALSDPATAQWVRTALPEGQVGLELLSVAAQGDTLFAGAYRGRLYRSTDGGRRWIDAAAGLPVDEFGNTPSVLALLARRDTVYAGTESGFFRSSDAGLHWEAASVGLPGSPLVYALLEEDRALFAGTTFGVFRSDGGGARWTASRDGLPRNDQGDYLPTESLASYGGYLFAGTYDGIYRSGDGAAWEAVNAGIPPNRGMWHPRILAFAALGEHLFAATIDGGGVYRSADSGESWMPVSAGLPHNPSGSVETVLSLASLDGVLLAVAGGSIYRSVDQGESWSQSGEGVPEGLYIPELAVQRDDVFAATFRGLYQSSDRGATWNLVLQTVPSAGLVYALGAGDEDLFAAGEEAEGYQIRTFAYRSPDGDQTWVRADSSLQGVTFFSRIGGDLFAGGAGLYRSPDGGQTWASIGTGLPGQLIVNAVAAIDGRLFAGLGRYYLNDDDGAVYVTTDGGATWEAAGLSGDYVRTLAAVGDSVLAGVGGLLRSGGVYLTTDHGKSWRPVDTGLPEDVRVYELAVAGGRIYAVTRDGVYVSSKAPLAWTPFDAGLPPDLFVQALLAAGDRLVAGTDRGVYTSPARTADWRPVNDGLDERARDVLSMARFQESLFIGTRAGLWRRPLADVVSVGDEDEPEVPDAVRLEAAYPNPFRGSTTVSFVLARPEEVSVKVYDVLGREVATLFSGRGAAGTHRLVWDASQQPSGLYLCRLDTAGSRQTRTLVLLR